MRPHPSPGRHRDHSDHVHVAAATRGRSAHSTASECTATCPRKPGWTLLARAAAGSSRQHCVQGQIAGEHHPPSGRKQVGRDHVFRHSGYVPEGNKARSPGRCHPETSMHAATHPRSTSSTFVPRFGTNHRQDVLLQRSQASPRPWYPTTLHGSRFRQVFNNVVKSIFHA